MRNKYRAIRTEYGGVVYASKAEADYAHQLDMLKRGGAIFGWTGQPRFRLGCPENVYVADFVVFFRDHPAHIVDVKGMATTKFRRDMKLWKKYGPCPLQIVRNGKTEKVIYPDGWEPTP